MTQRDFLWCALHMMLDDEEELSRLCPSCRAKAEEEPCPACGGARSGWQESENSAFDMDRYVKLKGGDTGD